MTAIFYYNHWKILNFFGNAPRYRTASTQNSNVVGKIVLEIKIDKKHNILKISYGFNLENIIYFTIISLLYQFIIYLQHMIVKYYNIIGHINL